jgi:hypothetical protein
MQKIYLDAEQNKNGDAVPLSEPAKTLQDSLQEDERYDYQNHL